MAFMRHVQSVLLRGQTTDLLINSLKHTNFQRLCYFSSFTRNESQLFQDTRKARWSCAVPNVGIPSSVRFYNKRAPKYRSQRYREPSNEESDAEVVPPCTNKFNPALVEELLSNMDGDKPVSSVPDPFQKDYHRCFICRYNIEVDHKNTRLLSQFVSPYTGRIYGRAITGLCIPMQRHVSHLIVRARTCGFMPFIMKDPNYLKDPQPYDAMSKQKNY